MGVEPRPAAADDDAAPFSAYVTSLIGMKAREVCRKPGFGRSDHDDVVQELKRRLLAKRRLFDPGRGASFDTFANRVVVSEVKMMLRDRGRLKRAPGFRAASLERATVEVGGAALPLSATLSTEDRDRRRGDGARADDAEARETRQLLADALAALPPDLAAVAERLKTESPSSIAKSPGMSRRRVDSAVAEIRLHFEARGLGETK